MKTYAKLLSLLLSFFVLLILVPSLVLAQITQEPEEIPEVPEELIPEPIEEIIQDEEQEELTFTAEESEKQSISLIEINLEEKPLLSINHFVGVTYRNWGLMYIIRVYKRWMLFDTDNILWKNCHVDLGFVNDLSPAFNIVGGYVEVEPIAVLNMRLDVQQYTLFNIPGKPFNAYGYYYYPDDGTPLEELDFSANYRASGSNKQGETWKATYNYGFRMRLSIRLQAEYWRIAIVDMIEMSFQTFAQKSNETYWYDPMTDAIHKRTDFDFNSYLFLLFKILGYDPTDENTLYLGAGWKYLWVVGTQYKNNRVGLGLYWMMWEELWFMENPVLLFTALWYLDDPYKTKKPMGYVPFIGLTFSFNTDIY